MCLLVFYYEDSETRVICYLSLVSCLTGYCRLIQQVVGTCFNAVVHNLPHNSGALFLLKFFTKVVCHLRNIALTWIASPKPGRITFTFHLAPPSRFCSLLKDKILWFEIYIPRNLVFAYLHQCLKYAVFCKKWNEVEGANSTMVNINTLKGKFHRKASWQDCPVCIAGFKALLRAGGKI